MPALPKFDLLLQCDSNQNPSSHFKTEINRLILKLTRKCKGPIVARIVLKNKSKTPQRTLWSTYF